VVVEEWYITLEYRSQCICIWHTVRATGSLCYSILSAFGLLNKTFGDDIIFVHVLENMVTDVIE